MKTVPTNTTSTAARASAAALAKGNDLGLVYADLSSYQEPIVLAVFGGPGSGKSRLIATAKGDIGLLPTESKSRMTVLKEAEKLGKRVILPSIGGQEADLIRTAHPMLLASIPETCIVIGDAKHQGWKPGEIQDKMQELSDAITLTSVPPDCCQRHYFRWSLNRQKHVAYMMLEDDRVGTIAIDTFGTMVDGFSYANYGITGVIDPKEYGFAPREDMNKEVREFLNNMSRKNLILTHHASSIWKENKPTNSKKPDGKFGKLGHYTSVMIEMVAEENVKFGQAGRYKAVVRDCQYQPALIGETLLIDEDINFQNLALAVYPESAFESWE